MIGELKFIVTGELIYVAGVLVLLMTVISIPVVLLNRRCTLMNVIAGTFVTFGSKDNVLIKFYEVIHGLFTALLFHNCAVVYENLNRGNEGRISEIFFLIKMRLNLLYGKDLE